MCRIIKWIARLISSVGAMNWGLEKFFKFNLVDYVTQMSGVASLDQILYGIVAVAGVIAFIGLFFCCKGTGCGCKCEPCQK